MTLAIDNRGLLPPKRHKATLAEVAELFVERAPFSDDRAVVWDTFLVYRRRVLALLPSARFWIDGGFVTHKTWAPPKDLDVVILAPPAEIDAVELELDPLLTDIHADPRHQPMGGLIDGFLCALGSGESTAYWSHTWTRVTDCQGELVPGEVKGYVEVVER